MFFSSKKFQPSITDDEITSWYAGKDLTPEQDWFSHNIPNWLEIFQPRRSSVKGILEIGSLEGRSALFFLEYFPQARLKCIDANKNVMREKLIPNLSKYAGRVDFFPEYSTTALHGMQKSKTSFDLIYIDGNHSRDQVMIDSLLSWPMLNAGGLLIWDDYDWPRAKDITSNPKQAIDTFIGFYKGELKVVHHGYQVMVERTA